MILALLVLLALGEGYRRTRRRIAVLRPRVVPELRALARGAHGAWRDVAAWEWGAIAALTAVGVALRLRDLAQPIRYDEAATWLDYASRPLAQGLSDYRFPNNHLFHTLLVHLSAAAFGDGAVALRLPAFVAGLLLVPLVWVVGRTLHGRCAGAIAAAFAAVSADLVLYATNARGYSIVACLTLVLALMAERQRRHDDVAGWLVMALVAALGAWTIPIMLYPIVGVAFWLWVEARTGDALLDGRTMRTRLGWTGAAALAVTALLYLPVIAHSGVALLFGNRFVVPQSRRSFFAALPGFFVDVWGDWTRGWPVALVACFAVGVIAALLLPARVGRARASLFAAALAAAAVLLVVNGRIPYLRVWLYLLPLAFVAAGGGLAWLADEATRAVRLPALSAALVAVLSAAIALTGARGLLAGDVVRRADDTGTLRDGAAIAALLARASGPRDHLVATAPSDVPLRYHLSRLRMTHDLLRATPDSAPRLWVVVNDDAGQNVPALLRAAEVMTIDFAPPRLVARFDGARLFALDRTQPGCVLAPERCR